MLVSWIRRGMDEPNARHPTACHAAKNAAPRGRQACPRRGAGGAGGAGTKRRARPGVPDYCFWPLGCVPEVPPVDPPVEDLPPWARPELSGLVPAPDLVSPVLPGPVLDLALSPVLVL